MVTPTIKKPLIRPYPVITFIIDSYMAITPLSSQD